MSGLAGFPPILVLAFTALVIILLTELTSNTATVAFFPSMEAIAVGLGIEPFLMTIVVTFAVSCAFMLPVATPSNAVAAKQAFHGHQLDGALVAWVDSTALPGYSAVAPSRWPTRRA